MSGYDFHPEALIDLEEIWDFIGEDNLGAADRMVAEILAAIRALVTFPHQGIVATILQVVLCASNRFETI